MLESGIVCNPDEKKGGGKIVVGSISVGGWSFIFVIFGEQHLLLVAGWYR